VLSGGELPAMILVDAVSRLVPGVLGDMASAEQDSFTEGLLDHPHYTRPEVMEGLTVPEVLLSGNHESVRTWRLQQALGRTWLRRPELLNNLALTDEQERLLAQFVREQRDEQQ
jgi:tRNA (guanine37-N1)-methyltransferase